MCHIPARGSWPGDARAAAEERLLCKGSQFPRFRAWRDAGEVSALRRRRADAARCRLSGMRACRRRGAPSRAVGARHVLPAGRHRRCSGRCCCAGVRLGVPHVPRWAQCRRQACGAHREQSTPCCPRQCFASGARCTAHAHARPPRAHGMCSLASRSPRQRAHCGYVTRSTPPRVSQALDKYNIEKDIASFIKKEFDKKFGPTWHCIVGRNFGAWRRGCARGTGRTPCPE